MEHADKSRALQWQIEKAGKLIKLQKCHAPASRGFSSSLEVGSWLMLPSLFSSSASSKACCSRLRFATQGAWKSFPLHAPFAVLVKMYIHSNITAVPKIVPSTRKKSDGNSSPMSIVLTE